MILIAFGSSIPFGARSPRDNVTAGARAVGRLGRDASLSSLYQSPAWPDPSDPPFINAVMRLETDLDADALLAALHAIEAAFGRKRGRRNGPRTLDLDLIDFRGEVRSGVDGLRLPHPATAERDFVLAPILEVAPEWRHPVSGLGAAALLARIREKTATPLANPCDLALQHL